MPAGYPGAPGGGGRSDNPGGGNAPDGAPAFGAAGPGGAGANNQPADFSTPQGGIQAFLNALSARDPDLLADAVALRSEYEARAANQPRLKAILNKELDSTELDEIAKGFDNLQIAGMNERKSTGLLGFSLARTDESGHQESRVVYVRKEKAGWKVLDWSVQREVKARGAGRNSGQNSRTGGGGYPR
jgi:hypothetical protein